MILTENASTLFFFNIENPPSAVESLTWLKRLKYHHLLIFCGMSVLTVTAINIGRILAVSLGLIYRQVVTLWRVRVTLVLCWLVYITRGIRNHSILSIYLIISNMGITFSMLTSTFFYIAIYIKLRRQQAQLQV